MSNEDYEIGYKKPPKENRFQKGKSGNPKGRPKATKDFKKLIEHELDTLIQIRNEHGQTVSLTKREALAKQLVAGALKLNHHALKYMPDAIDLKIKPETRREKETKRIKEIREKAKYMTEEELVIGIMRDLANDTY